MFEAPETLPELLSLLTQGFVVILLFVLILIGIRILRILGDVQIIVDSISDIVDTINTALWQPVKYFQLVMDTVKKFFGKKK